MIKRDGKLVKIGTEDANLNYSDMIQTIDVLSGCLKQIDLSRVVEQIVKEIPSLFKAATCRLFVCDDHSKTVRSLSTCRKHSLLDKGCFPRLKNCFPRNDQSIIYHNPCDEPGCTRGCIVIRLGRMIEETNPRKDPERSMVYMCISDFQNTDDPDMTQMLEKAKLVRDILGPHIHNARLYQRAHVSSLTDTITGIGSRKLFEDKLEQECIRTQRYGRPLSLAIVDLDNFKIINDALGHAAGDETLRRLADYFKSEKRLSDVLARYGGDEFVILMPETTSKNASEIVERVRRRISKLQISEDLSITISSGIAQSSEDDPISSRELFRRADAALYEAKNAGRDRFVIWDKSISIEPGDKDVDIEKIKRLQRRIAGLSEKSEMMFIQSIAGLVRALEAKDPYSKKHSENVTDCAVKIARKMCLGPGLTKVIRNAAMIHDIGKIGIPDSILSKPGRLNRHERRIMEQHPLIAVRILEKMTFLEREIEIVKHHHEAWNGQGYPDGLAGTAIPIGARILAVADTLDALTSDRPYRQSYSVNQATNILCNSSEYDFDPEVVEAAMCCLVGSSISDGSSER